MRPQLFFLSLFLSFIYFFNKYFFLGLLICEMEAQYSLWPVEGDDRFFFPGLAGGLNLVYKVSEDFAGEISASPVKCEFTAFFGGLESTFIDILKPGERELFLTVIAVAAVRTGRRRCDQRFMIPENIFVIQIEIVIADADRSVLIFAQSIVEGGIQMIVLPVDADNVPGVAVFNAFFRIVSADGDDAPESQSIAENLYRFGDSLTDTDTMTKRADDFVGIWLFQLVIADIFTDKVVDIFFLIPFGKLQCRAHELVYTGSKSLLVFADLILVKNIFRDQDQIGRVLIIAVFKSYCPEDLRMVQLWKILSYFCNVLLSPRAGRF